jgi:long-chain fatty acid transport protein
VIEDVPGLDRHGSAEPQGVDLKKLGMILAGALAASVPFVTQSHAGGLYINEFATPSMGTAGAGAEAWANDASTAFAFQNPAGMTRLEGHQISLGAGIGKIDAEFDANSNTPFGGGNGGDAGGLVPILGSHGVLSVTDDLKLGMSVFSVSGAALDYKNSWAGRFQDQQVSILTLTANPTVAYRVTDWLSLAGGVMITYADLDFKLAVPPGGAGSAKIDGDDITHGFNFGALFELSPQTRIGVVYVSEQEVDFDGNLKVNPVGVNVGSTTKLDLAQAVRVGGYHEINDQWAVLGTVGWEDWSTVDSLLVNTNGGGGSIPRNWKDTYHFSIGAHYKPVDDWLLQAGVTYDTSPVDAKDRTADMPIDRQIRLAVGAQHQWSETMTVGGAFEYIDLGSSRISDPNTLTGDYQTNRAFFFALNVNFKM